MPVDPASAATEAVKSGAPLEWIAVFLVVAMVLGLGWVGHRMVKALEAAGEATRTGMENLTEALKEVADEDRRVQRESTGTFLAECDRQREHDKETTRELLAHDIDRAKALHQRIDRLEDKLDQGKRRG